MSINVVTVFGEEIEKIWRNQVSREAVFQLRLMGEQLMTMEKAINTQQRMIEKLLHFSVLEGKALQELKQLQKRFDAEFDKSNIETEKIDDEKPN